MPTLSPPLHSSACALRLAFTLFRSPDGVQLKALKDFLFSPAGSKFKHVWIDMACMPQDQPKGTRSAEDAAAFKTMLSQVNMLYLGTSVLILLDLSYISRFCERVHALTRVAYVCPLARVSLYAM